MALQPHPLNYMADRISELERRAFPSVMIYTPLQSPSGKWEAVAEKWVVIEADPAAFYAEVQGRLAP